MAHDDLNANAIKDWLMPAHRDCTVQVFPVLDSTIIYAKQLVAANAAHKTLILAETQTAGRGRLGKSFFSPPRSGIYLTLLLRPPQTLPELQLVTLATAVAVCQTIENLQLGKPRIKWVNDILIADANDVAGKNPAKKVCGILSETVGVGARGNIDALLVSCGVNVNAAEFPPDLQEIATALNLAAHGIARNRFAAEIVNNFFALFPPTDTALILREYRQRLAILGKLITYQQKGQPVTARAIDINEVGNLIVENAGILTVLNSGEISVRLT